MPMTCPRCGAPLEAPAQPCPRCALDQALRASTPPPEEDAVRVGTAARPPRPPAPTPAELAPLFPELELEALLGEGGMGAVYRARQKKLGRTVALKLLHADLSADPTFVARFLREASALARLTHPGIVAVHEYGEQGARCWLVMEHVDGTNLRTLLRERRLEPRQALAIVRQLCDALQYAHDEGVVHRDIKPENVLVDRRGNVKIADFGLAKLVGVPEAHLTQVDQVMGTPHYMAPEQVERPRDVDHRADIYSLGVVFYEMLTGELPLGRFAPPSRRVEVDVRLDEVVLRSLEHERERRYQHAVEVKTDVQRIETSPAPTAPAPRAQTLSQAERAQKKKEPLLVWGLKGTRDGLRVMPGNTVPTAWGWFWILCAAWAVCGASFNLGPFVFGLVSLPLLGWLFLSVVRFRRGWSAPADAREQHRRHTQAVTSFALGALALFLALIGSWERFAWSYVSRSADSDAGVVALQGREFEALRRLEPTLDVAGLEPELQVRKAYLLDVPEAFERAPVWLALLALGLLGLAAWSAARPSARAAPRLVASSLGLFLGPLVVLQFAALALSGFQQSLTELHQDAVLESEPAALNERLYRACIGEDWRVSAQHEARIVDRRTGAVLAEVRTLLAAPSSPFDRWQLSWRGPLRREPRAVFTIVSHSSGASQRCLVSVDGGLAEHDFVDRWRPRLAALLAP